MQELILLFKVDRTRRTEFFTRLAGSFNEVCAILLVHHGEFGHGLRKGCIDCLAIPKTRLVYLVDHFLRALLFTDTTACTEFFINKPGLFFDGHMKVAHIPSDIDHFAPCHQGDVRMCSRLDHARREDTCRTIQGWKGLVELCHVSANGRLTFDQINMKTRIGNFKRRLNARNAAAHHQCIGIDRHLEFIQRLIFDHSRYRT